MDDEEAEEILYRLDERTEHIQKSFTNFENRVDERLNKQNNKIKTNRKNTQAYSLKIAIGAWGIAAVLSAGIATFMGVIPV